MPIRNFFSWIFVFLFVVVALPIFFIYGLSKTFLTPTFYETSLLPGAHDFLIDVFSQRIYKSNDLLQRYFSQKQLQDAFGQSFSNADLKAIIHGFTAQVIALPENPDQPLVLDLNLFQQDIVKTMNVLAIDVFKALPRCGLNQSPDSINAQGIPACIPENVQYQAISQPLAKAFEKSVDGVVPGKMQIDFSAFQSNTSFNFIEFFSRINQLKLTFFIALFVLLALIALVVYRPFLTILRFEGFAFGLSGVVAFIISFGFGQIPLWFLQQMKSAYERFLGMNVQGERLEQFLQHVFSFFTFEFNKIAFFFIIMGAVLLFLSFFLRYTSERSES